MSRSVNKASLIGHLGKDAETKYTPKGVAVTTFSVATSHRYKQNDEWKEQTDWHNIVLWQQENVGQYLTKGKQVYISGRIQTRSYENRDGQKRTVTEIIADEVILLGGGKEDDPRQTAASSRGPGTTDQITDDDVPF
jgi:single-strand DNA-binding protein